MPELNKPAGERFGHNPSDWNDPFSADNPAGSVRVSTAAMHDEFLPVGGLTVGEIRRRYADRLGIDPNGHAILNGEPADESTIVRTGESLFFQRAAGEKGRALPAAKLLRHASSSAPHASLWKCFLAVAIQHDRSRDRRRPLRRAS